MSSSWPRVCYMVDYTRTQRPPCIMCHCWPCRIITVTPRLKCFRPRACPARTGVISSATLRAVLPKSSNSSSKKAKKCSIASAPRTMLGLISIKGDQLARPLAKTTIPPPITSTSKISLQLMPPSIPKDRSRDSSWDTAMKWLFQIETSPQLCQKTSL